MFSRKLHIPKFTTKPHAECTLSLLTYLGITYQKIDARGTGDYYELSIPSEEVLKILKSLDRSDYIVLIDESEEGVE